MTLIKLMALRGRSFDDEVLFNLDCSYEEIEPWLRKKGFVKCLLLLALYFEKFDAALRISREFLSDKRFTGELLAYYTSNVFRYGLPLTECHEVT